jgi:hypothetical protein
VGNRLTINQDINISDAKIILLGSGSELRFSSEILGAQTMKLTGTSSIELRNGANIQSTSDFFGYNGNAISINGTTVFQGHSTKVNSGSSGVVNGPASVYSSMAPPVFVNLILPVKLIGFNANEFKGRVVLRWITSEEENFDHFEIERSLNGKEWSTIGSVDGMKERHNNPAYSFTDQSPTVANYYRLKMIDIDLQFGYGSIVAVKIAGQHEAVKVYPNPATVMLFVSNTQPGVWQHLEFTNASGQVVLTRKYCSSESVISMNVGSLKKGMYFLTISDAKGLTQTCDKIVIK